MGGKKPDAVLIWIAKKPGSVVCDKNNPQYWRIRAVGEPIIVCIKMLVVVETNRGSFAHGLLGLEYKVLERPAKGCCPRLILDREDCYVWYPIHKLIEAVTIRAPFETLPQPTTVFGRVPLRDRSVAPRAPRRILDFNVLTPTANPTLRALVPYVGEGHGSGSRDDPWNDSGEESGGSCSE